MELANPKEELDKGYRFYMNEHLKFLLDSLKEYYYRLDFINYTRVRKQIDQLRSVMNSLDSTSSAQRSTMCED